MKTKGSKQVTATSFAKVKHLQNHSTADWREIERLTGHGRTTQQNIKKAVTFERYKAVPALKRRTDRAVKRMAVKQQAIERNTKRKAVRIAVRSIVDENTTRALEAKITSLARDVKELTDRIVDLEDSIAEKIETSAVMSDAELLERNVPIFDDAMLADAEHNRKLATKRAKRLRSGFWRKR